MTPDLGNGAASAFPSARRAGTGISLPVAMLLVLAAAAGSGYLGARWAADELEAALALRPRLVDHQPQASQAFDQRALRSLHESPPLHPS